MSILNRMIKHVLLLGSNSKSANLPPNGNKESINKNIRTRFLLILTQNNASFQILNASVSTGNLSVNLPVT